MISEAEFRMLDVLNRRLLAKQKEVMAELSGVEGVGIMLDKLVSCGFVKIVEPMGEKCCVITQKGINALKDAKSASNKPQRQGFLTA